MRDRLLLGLILVLYICLGTAYAIKTPKWQAPDEPAHFNYIRDIAQGYGLPVLKQGDFDVDYLEQIKAAKFPDNMPIDSIRYEAHQPPLYYLLASPVMIAGNSLPLPQQVILLRLFSVFLGSCLLLVSYLSTKVVFGKGLLALSVPAFIAFIPQHVAMTAAINNDTLAELVLSLVVLMLVYRINSNRSMTTTLPAGKTSLPVKYLLLLGLLLGAALLTKLVVYVSLVLAPIGLLAAAPPNQPWRKRLVDVIRQSFIVYPVALLVSGWWFVRNTVVYGNLDFLGSKTHDMVAGSQELTGILSIAKLQEMAETMFKSFWAQFGWMGVPADARTYFIVGALSFASTFGFVFFLLRLARNPNYLSQDQKLSLGILALTFIAVFVGVFQYNLQYLQPQGRYLFPALIPIATFVSLGMREVFSRRFAPVLMSLVFVGLSFLSAYSLVRFVIPWLS